MAVIETSFKINDDSKIIPIISGKKFRNDKDFIETLEDFLFGKILEESDNNKYVEENEVFRVLSKNIGK